MIVVLYRMNAGLLLTPKPMYFYYNLIIINETQCAKLILSGANVVGLQGARSNARSSVQCKEFACGANVTIFEEFA